MSFDANTMLRVLADVHIYCARSSPLAELEFEISKARLELAAADNYHAATQRALTTYKALQLPIGTPIVATQKLVDIFASAVKAGTPRADNIRFVVPLGCCTSVECPTATFYTHLAAALA